MLTSDRWGELHPTSASLICLFISLSSHSLFFIYCSSSYVLVTTTSGKDCSVPATLGKEGISVLSANGISILSNATKEGKINFCHRKTKKQTNKINKKTAHTHTQKKNLDTELY